MKRTLLIVGGLVVLLVVGVVVFLFTGLNGAIKAIVEGVGSRATGTDVTLAMADVSLTSGDGSLNVLKVGNPKGYGTPTAIEFDKIHIQIDTSTVTSDTVVIKEVLIEGPRLTYELGPGGSNIGVIQENVSAFRGDSGGGGSKGGGKGGGGGGKDTTKEEGGRKVIIENLIVRSGHVDVSASFLKGQKIGCPLHEIHLHDIGKSSGGATAAEVAKELLTALVDSALEAVKGLNVDALQKSAGEAIGGVLKGATDLLGGKKKSK